jgi:hypothetical protein
VRGEAAGQGQEPAVARGRAHALVAERRDERAQPVGARPRVGVHEDEDLARSVGLRDGRAQVVNLLPAVGRAPGDDEARARDRLALELARELPRDVEPRVVGAVGDEDQLV